MTNLTSKLQYKRYEKGEYAEEKGRTFAATLQLIKDFPWDEQRGEDVQLTGPSVTIKDENDNYLKVGLYFNGKFCLYYFTDDHRLFEHPVTAINEVELAVKDFFNETLDFEKFDRNRTVFHAISHFETGTFYYEVKGVNFYAKFILIIFLGLIEVLIAFMMTKLNAPLLIEIIFPLGALALMSFIIYQQYMVYKYYMRSKDAVLELSAGSSTFNYGEDGNLVKYSKSDIVEINIYGRISGKGTPPLTLSELVFSNGLTIKLPVMLIDPLDIQGKFFGVKFNRFTKRRDYTSVFTDFANGK